VSARPRGPGWRRATAATVGALVAGVALSFLVTRLPLDSEGEHFAGHFLVGFPVLLVLVAVLWAWPRPSADRTSRMARSVLVVGLAMFGGGQVVEGVGAFGYDGHDRVNALAGLHNLGFAVGLLGWSSPWWAPCYRCWSRLTDAWVQSVRAGSPTRCSRWRSWRSSPL
jgi:hypothetical protein